MILEAHARRIRLLGLDVDGVLTDNGIWLAPIDGARVEFKRFDVGDGLGLVVLRHTPVEVAWISGRPSDSTELRARDLKITTLIQDASARKLPAMEALLKEKGLAWEELAYVGDDLADLPVLRRAGIAIAVSNACPEVKAASAYVTSAPGGHGAVREAVEMLLRARGEWESAVGAYLRERGETPA
jgi:3-deoxy-D-manno-octulosonate 8-phosphate phosphatase (KDO 8-P phosphatase)